MSTISEQQIQDYQRDGVIVLRNYFTQPWLEKLASGIERCRLEPSSRSKIYVDDADSSGHLFFDARTVGEIDGFDGLMLESPMAEAAGRLMKARYATPFYITVFVRTPGTQQRTPWHQDQPSWSAGGEQGCSMWMSLDPVPAQTGLEFVRGSHRWKTKYSRDPFFQTEYEDGNFPDLQPFPDIESHRDDYDIVSWAMEPGDCVVFHGMLTHGGSGNLPANLGRRTVSVQWLGDDARYRVVPGGDDPNISAEVVKFGIQPGDPLVSDLCPVVWKAE